MKSIGAPLVIVQLDCGATDAVKDYPALMNSMVEQMVAAFEKGGAR